VTQLEDQRYAQQDYVVEIEGVAIRVDAECRDPASDKRGLRNVITGKFDNLHIPARKVNHGNSQLIYSVGTKNPSLINDVPSVFFTNIETLKLAPSITIRGEDFRCQPIEYVGRIDVHWKPTAKLDYLGLDTAWPILDLVVFEQQHSSSGYQWVESPLLPIELLTGIIRQTNGKPFGTGSMSPHKVVDAAVSAPSHI